MLGGQGPSRKLRFTSSDVSLELRAVIKFCALFGMTPKMPKKKIEDATGMQTVCRSLIYKWHKRLWYGQEEIDDDQILDFVKFIELYIKHQLTG